MKRTLNSRRSRDSKAKGLYLYNAGGVFACRAVELILLQVGHCKEPAALAHVHSVGVTLIKKALLQPQS